MAAIGTVAQVARIESKNYRKHEKETENAPPLPVDVKLQSDMVVVSDAFRLNERTRIALEEYDATTLEDLAYMTSDDYDNMVATAARLNRPIAPLQQRKVVILMRWVKELAEDSDPFTKRRPNEKEKEFQSGVVIPPDWKSHFFDDIPRLKRELRELGETSSWSVVPDLFVNLKWICCGL